MHVEPAVAMDAFHVAARGDFCIPDRSGALGAFGLHGAPLSRVRTRVNCGRVTELLPHSIERHARDRPVQAAEPDRDKWNSDEAGEHAEKQRRGMERTERSDPHADQHAQADSAKRQPERCCEKQEKKKHRS